MLRHKTLVILAFAAAGFFVWENFLAPPAGEIPLTAAAAKDLHAAPVQQDFKQTFSMKFHRGKMEFLAAYQITARVFSSKTYGLGKESELSPLDLALGWGAMADPAIITGLAISQSSRWWFYQWKGRELLSFEQTNLNSANTHIIPATGKIEKALKALRIGQIVTLRGYLVAYHEGDSDGGWWSWRSSMSRSDQDRGACELMYVEAVTPYR